MWSYIKLNDESEFLITNLQCNKSLYLDRSDWVNNLSLQKNTKQLELIKFYIINKVYT